MRSSRSDYSGSQSPAVPQMDETASAAMVPSADGDERLTWTVRESAERLGLPLSTTYWYVECGILPAVRLGTRVLIPREAVERLVEKALGDWGGPDGS